jgi:hypothetical protein
MKSAKPPAPPPLSTAKSADFRNAAAAFDRARQRARDLAKQTDTYLVVQQAGQLVKLKVN